MAELTGRGAVVVGGTSGIGRAVAAALAAEGAGVVVNGRDPAVVARVSAELGVLGVPGSAADPAVADQLIGTCAAKFGAVDVLVNCAGIAEPDGSSILTVRPEEWRTLLDSHLETVFTTCRAAAPLMVEQGRGTIVNTSSFAYLGDYGGTGYAAGKGAVTSLTLAIAAELREHGIRANVVCPGARTRLSTGDFYEAKIHDLNQRGMLDELSTRGALDAPPPEYAAQLYLYLATDRAKDITGQIFIAAGNFVGRFDRPTPSLVAYRDHNGEPPWSLDELERKVR
ncbi:SDR family NAD(P)-dependent oxidoreductase [Nocardia asteroides]|uniref:SDR family NAD(P)-dependent oxidoreductase n=1 Tax=Nocardia asteroides TaxID=1824 RepID=UPI001E60595E|nr:SDR family oxidoreductase [Nocardia asteroides]UGT64512.1 SDR family oxidoreductase [Nocardia asteroides]